ncbi:M48 family metalloprotease [Pseudomonas rhodesiae]|jgi:Zn-dependent protease with chaperone function|uniref:M48 family metalloprotease n=1 Tax=Pseudomonas rhodesiae TaxID=76760 RepID=UPI0024E02B1F|nr:M48 family metalloprotease [Pseudomonas rhodesiae]WHT79265.1 Protease HtpX [Pseudomonas rhodesiae]
MNFFEQQDRAKRRSTYRMLLTSALLLSPAIVSSLFLTTPVQWHDVLMVCVAILPFIAVGYWYQWHMLKGGGSAIAEKLGGYLLNHDCDEDERWLLDVVEEMAIASGSPIPLVYILDVHGVNAFAAGRTPQDSVIGVTYGAAVILNRDEMQAVVAHLFCNIQNNDMRVYARMFGIYLGTICLAMLSGYLIVIGFCWAYLVYLSMSRVLRQRKYLADAVAAQFTRDPQSVASTLKKIGGYEYGSWIGCDENENFLSIFFATPYKGLVERWGSPFPPLEKRIRRFDPHWNGEYPNVPPLEALMGDDEQAEENRRRWEVLGGLGIAASDFKGANEEPAQLYQTQATVGSIPPEVLSAARHPDGAQALIYQLLLSEQPALRTQQLTWLQELPNTEVAHFLQVLDELVGGLNRYLRLPLFDLCGLALKKLPTDQYKTLIRNMMNLVAVDSRTLLVGWALVHLLDAKVLSKSKTKGRYTLARLENNVTWLLATLAFIGHRSDVQAELAYYRACDVLPFYTAPLKVEMLDDKLVETLDNVMEKLQQLKPEDKEILMEAVAVCIECEGNISHEEIEFARAIADVLACPMPEGLETPLIKEDATSALPS